MSINNASIFGVGKGEAQVFGSSPLVNTFAQLLQREQAKRDREQQLLASEMAKVKIDGLREPDRPDFFNKYQEVKSTAAKIPYERDGWKRAQLKADVDQKLLELQNYANKSKDYGTQYKDFQGKLLDNRFRDQFNDDAIAKVSNSNKLPINDPNFVRDFTSLGRQVDGEKIDKMIGSLDGTLLKKTQWGNPVQTASKQGNKSGTMFYNKREVDPTEQLAAYANVYSGDANFRKYIHDQYKDIFDNNDPEQAKALALKDFADRRRSTGILSEATAPVFKPNDAHYEHKLFDLMHRAEKTESGASTHRQKVIGGLMNSDPNYITEAQTYLPQGSKVQFLTSEKNPKINSKGGYNLVRFSIPDMYDDKGNITPGLTEDVSLSKGDPTNRINAILNQYTGEKISPSKLNTEGGKPRGRDVEISRNPTAAQKPVAQVSNGSVKYNGKTYKMDAVQKAASASGMSVKEYLKAIGG